MVQGRLAVAVGREAVDHDGGFFGAAAPDTAAFFGAAEHEEPEEKVGVARAGRQHRWGEPIGAPCVAQGRVHFLNLQASIWQPQAGDSHNEGIYLIGHTQQNTVAPVLFGKPLVNNGLTFDHAQVQK